jgi:putative nucleotidyltransferase with HDIG domain
LKWHTNRDAGDQAERESPVRFLTGTASRTLDFSQCFAASNEQRGACAATADLAAAWQAPGLRSPARVTLLSPSVTSFQDRNGARRTMVEAGGAWHVPARGAAGTMLDVLTRMMASRDRATAAHARRVQMYANGLARDVCAGDSVLIEAVQTAALLHDIGKLAIPDRLLHKPGPLTREEYEQVKHHAAIGAEMLEGIDFPGPLALIVRHHHENWDGSGYPDGLFGSQIPLGARLLAVVDCYDALTSERPYRQRLSHDRALQIIVERRGTSFDPMVSDAFVRVVQDLRATVSPDVAPYVFSLRPPRLV